MSRGCYLTATRLAALEASIDSDGRLVIEVLDRLRVATVQQLQRLYDSDLTTETAARRVRRTLERLTAERVVVRLPRRVGGVRSGSAGFVYGLDVAGQHLASGSGPAGGRRLRRPWVPSTVFLGHALAVSELYVSLVEAERSGAVELLAFDAEPHCWRIHTGLGGGRIVLKPDAFVRVGLGDFEDAYFVEVDRATESGPTVARKLTGYRSYFRTGREQERFGVFPRVLWLVPDETRKAQLVEIAAEQPPDTWELFQVAHTDDALKVFTGETP